MKKRLMLSLMTVALVALLASGATFALFTANTTNASNTFTAGTVTLGEPTDALINFGADAGNYIAPGDTNVNAGTFAVTYNGNLNAWLGLTTSTSGDIFADPNGLQLTITDNNGNSYSANQANQLIGSTAVTNGTTTTFTVKYTMPSAADNSYQGDTGTLTMSVKAVQANNNNDSLGGPTSWN